MSGAIFERGSRRCGRTSNARPAGARNEGSARAAALDDAANERAQLALPFDRAMSAELALLV